MFNSILGNDPLKIYLRKAIAQDQFPHAFLFSGIDGIGKSLFAKEIALYFLETTKERIENHPDFHSVHPEGKSGLHSIDSLRSLIDQVHSAPFEAPAKFFLIYDSERMQPAAANALLKTLEEPTPNTYFILLSSSSQEVLPTLQSRCTLLRFQPLSIDHITSILKEKGIAERFAFLSQGSVGRALELAQKDPLEDLIFPLLIEKVPYFKLCQSLEKIEKAIENEDPVKQNKNVDYLFTLIFMWYRDQNLNRLGIDKLFFPKALKSTCSLPPLDKIGKRIDEVRVAYQRNIKLSICLERIFSEFV